MAWSVFCWCVGRVRILCCFVLFCWLAWLAWCFGGIFLFVFVCCPCVCSSRRCANSCRWGQVLYMPRKKRPQSATLLPHLWLFLFVVSRCWCLLVLCLCCRHSLAAAPGRYRPSKVARAVLLWLHEPPQQPLLVLLLQVLVVVLLLLRQLLPLGVQHLLERYCLGAPQLLLLLQLQLCLLLQLLSQKRCAAHWCTTSC